jgi:hypothetical protein
MFCAKIVGLKREAYYKKEYFRIMILVTGGTGL